jgi:phosphate-selective porin OprO/OprP
MLFRMRLWSVAAGLGLLASPAWGQGYPIDDGLSRIEPSAYATLGDRPQQEDDTEQQALAKTLDDHNQRLQAVEQFAQTLAEQQGETTFADRFNAVEGDVKSSLEQIGEVETSLDDYVLSGHGDNRMKLSGRIHIDYWHFMSEAAGIDVLEGEDPRDRFGFRRLRFGVAGDIDDNMFYKIEMEFAGGNDVEFRDAYLGFDHLPCLNTLTIGNHKRPYGLDHLNSSRYNVFLERPFAIEAFNQDARRFGISSSGYTRDLCYNWRYGVWNQENIQDQGFYIGDDYQPEFASRLAKTWWWDHASNGRGYGHIGLSSSFGLPDGLGPNNQARYRTRPEARSTNRWIDTGTIAGAE